MLNVIILIGIPGSGKSTWAHKLIEEMSEPLVYISTDDIREEQFGDVADMSNNPTVFSILRSRFKAALQKSQSVILDATFVSAAERAPYISLAKSYHANVIAYYIQTDLNTALERNENRNRTVPPEAVQQRYEVLEPPEEGEGFDLIVTVRNGVRLTTSQV